MKKLEINKKTIIILAAVLVLIIAVVIGVSMCGKKEQEGADKDKNGKVNIKTEQNDDIDDENNTDNDIVDKEGGLQIKGPEEADKKEETNKVDFVNPDGSSNEKVDDTEGTAGDNKEDNNDKEEDPDENIEDDEKYGEIF